MACQVFGQKLLLHRRALPLYLVRIHWIHPLKRHNFISLRGQRLPLTSHALPLSTSWKSLVVCWNTWSACGVLSGGAVTLLSNVLLFEQTRMFCKRFLNFGIYLFWLYQNRRLARTVRFFLNSVFFYHVYVSPELFCSKSGVAGEDAQWLWTVFIFQWIDQRNRIALGYEPIVPELFSTL